MKSSKPFSFPESRPLKLNELPEVYQTLRKHFGHQSWWPGETDFEIIIGAILTQNTAWTNVEKAIANLKRAKKLTPRGLYNISVPRLASLIRPAGYFNVKAKHIKNFLNFLFAEYGGDLKQMFHERGDVLREKLLGVNGIGPETADSILLYAARKPFFVIDAYTKRIFSRHRLATTNPSAMDYSDWQKVFVENLPRESKLYNDFHAQIVVTAKHFCKSSRSLCATCPLSKYL